MNIGVELIADNVGMSIMTILMLILIVGNLVFWAVKFELGNLLLMFFSAALFIGAYANGWDYWQPAISLMLSIVLMAFSLLMSSKTEGVITT